MSTTQIQRVPGTFRLPAGWPRLEIPDTETGFLVDWDASSLTLGTLPEAGWAPILGSAGPMALVAGTTAPTVGQDAQGRKFVRLNKTRLRSYLELTGETTALVVLKAGPHEGNRVRILTGNNGYRGLYLTSAGYVADVGKTPAATSATVPAVPDPAAVTAVAARYGKTRADLTAYGKAWSGEVATTALDRQTEMTLGSSSINPPGEDTYLSADVYRIQLWDRFLTKTDVEAALKINAARYKF